MSSFDTHDREEIEKFKLFIHRCAQWDAANDDLPDFAPISEAERIEWLKKRFHAHVKIYQQIYREDP